MATVFSTATLGLSVDNKEFNKAMQSSERTATSALLNVSAQTDAFHARWKEMTGGLKDTKRIISGILVSQGFYALSNALVGAASAALNFSMSMETAGVSLEYFVDAAAGTEEAAQQVEAYLREVNAFAAKTPFGTDEVLTLSKYMQAVGVAMSQTQSVLAVITDTAAATGASEENLQRITFALGQMLTKGRIANEEIRQLANANIPIYQILQEELGLTGEQISNIGNYWVDAETAVVAILRGLDKRYAGASDKIAQTLTGLTDTILDDAKIIADTAFGGIYDKIVGTAGTLRDTLEEWRAIVTEQGAAGLANHLLIEIDPTGAIGNQILALIGNLRQLGGSLQELYHAAKPILGVLGQSFYASLNLATIAVTALSDAASGLIEFLDEAGISTSALAQGIASLYVAYKATQFISLLGQACMAAGMSAYQAASGIMALLPASLTARTGVTALTASVASLIAYLAVAAGMFGMLNNSFAGLQSDSGGLNSSWDAAYAEYEAQMAEYNAAIEAQQSKYRESYEAMAGDSTVHIEKEDDDTSGASGGGGSGQKDWVAAFDEVYDVPDDDDGTGAYQDAVLDDLGELLSIVSKFKFPTVSVPTLEMPSMADIYGESIWDAPGIGNMLPLLITGAVLSAGKVFAKSFEKINSKDVKEGIEKGGKGSVIVTDEQAGIQLKKLQETIETGQKQLDNLFKQLSLDFRRTNTLEASPAAFDSLSGTVDAIEKLSKSVSDASEEAAYYAKLTGKQFTAFRLSADNQLLLAQATESVLKHRLADIKSQLLKLTAEDAALETTLRAELNAIENALKKQGGTKVTSGVVVGYEQHKKALDAFGAKLDKAITAFAEQPFTKEAGMPRVYNQAALTEITEAISDGNKLLTEFKAHYGDTRLSLENRFEQAISQLKSINPKAESLFKKALEAANNYNAASVSTGKTVIAGINNVNGLGARIEGNVDKLLTEATDIAKSMSKLTPDALQEAYEEALKKQARDAGAAAKEAADRAATDARRASKQAERMQLAEAKAAERRAATGRKLDAAAIEPGNASRAVAAIEEAAAQNVAKLEELRTELGYAVSARRDFAGDPEQIAKIDKSIAAIKEEIASLEGKLPSKLSQKIDRVVELNAEQSARMLGISDKLASRLTEAPGIKDQTTAALEAWAKTFPDEFHAHLKRLGMSVNDLALTATKTVTALTGISDWGKTFPQIMADVFKEQGWFAGFESALPDPKYVPATERGVALEKYFGAATEVNLSAQNVAVHQGGHAAREGAGIIVQYDFAASGDFSQLFSNGAKNGIAAIDIKAVSSETVERLKQLVTPVSKGLAKADGSILGLLGRTDNMYELMTQSWVFSGKAGNQFVSFIDTGFDFEGINETFVRRVIQTYNNSANRSLGEAVGGRIFSDKAYEFAAKTAGKPYSWAMYEADIIGPLLTDAKSGLNFEKLADAVTTVALDFSKMLDDIDLPAIAKAYTDSASLFALLGKRGAQYLNTYATTIVDSERLLGSIDLAPTVARLTKANTSFNKFANELLRTTSMHFTGGSVGKGLRTYLDNLITEYTRELAAGNALATESFVAKLDELKKVTEQLRMGGKVTDDFAELFGRLAKMPAQYDDELKALSTVLDGLVSNASDANRLVATMYNVRRSIKQLQAAAETGSQVYSKSLDGLVTNYRSLCNMLGLSNEALAIRTGNEIQAIQRFVSEQGGSALLTPQQVKSLALPLDFLGITDAAQLTAQQVATGLQNGMISVGKRAGALLEEMLQGVALDSTPIAPLLAQLNALPARMQSAVVADLEATGLLRTSAAGTDVPYITQATFSAADSDKTLNRFIVTGNREQDIANLLRMQSLTNADGTLSDVAKAWQNVTVDAYLAEGVTLEDFFKEAEQLFGKNFALTGWNATGVTGYDDQMLRYSGAPSDLYHPVDDIMKQFSDAVQQFTGKTKNFKLVDAHEILFGKLELAAHLSDNDVDMAKDILRALQSGDAQKLLATADPLAIGSNNVVTYLKQLGEDYRMLPTYADEFAEEISYAARAAKEIPEHLSDAADAARVVSATAEEVSEAAAKSTFAESFERATSGIADNVKKWFNDLQNDNVIKDVFKRWFGKTSRESAPFYESDIPRTSTFRERWKGTADSYYRPLNVDELAANWSEAAIKLEDARHALQQAQLEGAADDVIKQLEGAVETAARGVDDAMTGLYRGIINSANTALKDSADDVLSSFLKYADSIDTGGSYIALYFDKTSRTFKTVGDTLNISGLEMLQRLNTSTKYIQNSAEYIDEIARQVATGTRSASEAAKHLETLSDLLKVKHSAELDKAFKVLTEALDKGLGNMDVNLKRYINAFTKNLPDAGEASAKIVELISDVKKGALGVEDFAESVAKYVDELGAVQTPAMKQALKNMTSTLDEGLQAVEAAAKQYAAVLKPAMGDAATKLAEAMDEILRAGNRGLDTSELLGEFAKLLDDEISETLLVINSKSGATEFAGKTAREAVEKAAGEIAEGIGALTKKILTASVGMFSVFDLLAPLIDSVLELVNLEKLQEQTGTVIAGLTSENTQQMFKDAQINLEDMLGETVYRGIEEALGQSVLVTLISSGIGTAVGLGIAGAATQITGATVAAFTGPVGWIAAAAAAVTGIIATSVINATGGNTNSYKHWDEYGEAVATGQFIDVDGLVEKLVAEGYTQEEARSAANEANTAAHAYYYQDIVNNATTESVWERGDISRLLHGAPSYMNVPGTSVNRDYNDTLRLGAAAGLIDVGSHTFSERMHGTDMSRTVLTVTDEAQLDVLADLLGVEREMLSVSEEIVTTRNMHGAQVSTHTGEYRVLLDGSEIMYSDVDLDLLADAFKMTGEYGFISGDVGQEITDTISGNQMLSDAYGDITYGGGDNWLTAQQVLEDFLKSYNAANQTNLTVDYLDTIGATQAILKNMVDTYETQSALWYNEAVRRNELTSENRNVLAGDTSSMLGNTDITGWSTKMLEELASYGLNFAAGEYLVNTPLGEHTVDYATVTTDYDALRENMAGVMVGNTTLADGTIIDVKSLQVSAADAEILAQAGIQINADGTISFMNALNEGSSGAERDLTLDAGAFSKNVLDALSGVGISVNFEAGELDFGDFTGLTEDMFAALFKMPDNINMQLSEEMRSVISEIGTITDSGFLQITNGAILSGNRTIASFIEEAGITVDELSPQVYESLMTIDALIQEGGGTIQENILEWSNGVVVPSPIKEEQLTEEMRLAFESMGIHFQEYGGQFMMVINQTGEMLTNGVSLIDAEKWLELDESVRVALEGLGVTATTVGNQMMIDLNGVFDGGVANIISLFINQPEVWAQIPDTVKAALEQSGIITGEQLIQIQTTLTGGLTEITGGWVTAWSTLGPECAKYLEEAGINTQEGLAQVTQYVGDADIGTVVDEGVIVPFESLPPELKTQMELAGENVEGTKVLLQTATETAVGGMLGVLDQTVTDAGDYATELGNTIATAISTAMIQLQNLQQLQGQVGSSGGFLGIGSKDNLIDYQGTNVGGTTYYKEYTTGGSTVKYWYIDPSTGQWATRTSLPTNAEGGPASGVFLGGELGTEMVIMPDGSTKLIGAGLYDAPHGSYVLNAQDTEMVRKYAGDHPSIQALADGNASIDLVQPATDGSAFMDALKALLLEVFFGVTDEDEAGALQSEQQAAADTNADTFSTMLQPMLQSELRAAEEIPAVAIRNAVDVLTAHNGETRSFFATQLTNLWTQYETLSTVQQTALLTAISEAASAVASSVGSYVSSLKSTISSLSSSLSSMKYSTAGGTTGTGVNAGIGSEDRAQYGGSAYDQVHFSTAELQAANAVREAAEAGETTWASAHAFVEDLRNNYGYSGGQDGSSYIKIDVDTEGNVDIKYSGSTISSNAYGGLITNDTLIRAGEFGKDEAVIPLEQPSVMAKLGTEIAEHTPQGGTAFTLTELQEMLKTELYAATEIVAVAVKNATAALSESDDTISKLTISTLTGNHAVLVTKLDGNQTAVLEAISSAASSIASSVGSYVSSLKSTISSMQSSLNASKLSGSGSGGGLSDEEREQYGGSAYDQAHFTDEQLKAAASIREAAEAGETTWADAHAFVEDLRSSYGYSGGDDGSSYIKVEVDSDGDTKVVTGGNTVKANAYGSLITGDTLLRAGEFGKKEAILPLEQPSVMAKLGSSIAEYTGGSALITLEGLQALLQTELYNAAEIIATAIRNAADMLDGNNGENSGAILAAITAHGTTLNTGFTTQHTSMITSIEAIVSSAASTIASSVGSYVSSLKSTISSMQSTISGLSSKGTGGAAAGSGLSSEDRAALGGSAYDQANFTDAQLQAAADVRAAAEAGETTWADAHAFVEEIRESYGYSGGDDGSKYIKGSARGSLITKDALYRAGEMGLNEAIIPLEQPDVLRQVGSTIASYMPVETVELGAALGMRNAGITPVTPAAPAFDPSSMVSAITQHVLESVLPAMAVGSGGESSGTPMYVGTLIADDKGLKQLERKLYKIRMLEEARRS